MKKAIITGGAKRLGAEVAISLATQGYDVVIHHNNSSPADVVKKIEALGRKAHTVKADLAGKPDWNEFFKFGPVDVLVNSASSFNKVPFEKTPEAEFDLNFNLHVKAPFFLSQVFAAQAPKGAQIINILDSRITGNSSQHFSYLLSKKALLEQTKMLAMTLGPNIRVNAVSPSAIANLNEADAEYIELRKSQSPLRSCPNSAEVVSAINFLLGSPHITGQNIFVDGGDNLI